MAELRVPVKVSETDGDVEYGIGDSEDFRQVGLKTLEQLQEL